jgi:thiol-disulfide isomerase/thioredoxin
MLSLILFSLVSSHSNPPLDPILEDQNPIKDTASVDLSDENFEHLTQASTGATTGDWFINFYAPDCSACLFFEPIWQSLARKVSATDLTVSIAKVDGSQAPGLVKRFGITGFPTLLYFRLGKYYHVTGPLDGEYLFEVVSEGKFKDYKAIDVPGPAGIFDGVSWSGFWGLPLYVHAAWIVILTSVVAFFMPSKEKTN